MALDFRKDHYLIAGDLRVRLGYFPNKAKFEKPDLNIATEDDSALDDDPENNQSVEARAIEWTIRELCDKEKSLETLQEKLSSDYR